MSLEIRAGRGQRRPRPARLDASERPGGRRINHRHRHAVEDSHGGTSLAQGSFAVAGVNDLLAAVADPGSLTVPGAGGSLGGALAGVTVPHHLPATSGMPERADLEVESGGKARTFAIADLFTTVEDDGPGVASTDVLGNDPDRSDLAPGPPVGRSEQPRRRGGQPRRRRPDGRL